MRIKFELTEQQQTRYEAWQKHHWEIAHKGFHPRGESPIVCWFIFGPTGIGKNVKVKCQWCNPGHQGHEVDLTEDEDGDGHFIVKYDENWNPLPPWDEWLKK
jgi:hypothetical protein